nr:head-tail connector protein [uncultured Moraxella sp.]
MSDIPKYATLSEVKHHLRYPLDDDIDDMMLSAFLASAETSVDNYITDEVTEKMLPTLKVATLLLVGNLDSNRNAENVGENVDNYLPFAVQRLLAPYRTPTAV